MSDARLPSEVTELSNIEELEGRVLTHGEEEITGRTYMLLEGTDHKIHFIYHTPEITAARHKGKLIPDSFVRMSRQMIGDKSDVSIQDFGDARRLLANKEYFREKSRVLINRGVIPNEGAVGGWPGKYETTLVHSMKNVDGDSRRLQNEEKQRPGRGR